MPDDLETFLQHHGIKGMKWGVRRTPEQLGHRPSLKRKKTKSSSKKKTSTSNKRKRLSGLFKKKTKKKTVKSYRKASDYSDDDLAKAVRRLQLEKQYNELVSNANKKTKTKGQKILEEIGNETLKYAKTTAKKVIEEELRKEIERRRRANN